MDEALLVYKASSAARHLHDALSHGPHELLPPTLERRLRGLPLPQEHTACTLATVRWVSTPARRGGPPAQPGGGTRSESGSPLPADTAAITAADMDAARMGGAVAVLRREVRALEDATVHEAYVLDRQAHACMDVLQPSIRDLSPPPTSKPALPRAPREASKSRWSARSSQGGGRVSRARHAVCAAGGVPGDMRSGAGVGGVRSAAWRQPAARASARCRRATAARAWGVGRLPHAARVTLL